MTTSLRLTLMIILCCGLLSCGQKGPLQRPDQTAYTASVR